MEAYALGRIAEGTATSHKISPIIADGEVGYTMPTANAAAVIPSFPMGQPSTAGEPSIFVRPQSEQQRER